MACVAEAGPGGGAAATRAGGAATEAAAASVGTVVACHAVAAVPVGGCRGTLGASAGDFSVVE